MLLLIKFLSFIIAVFGFCELMIYFDGPFDIIEKWRNAISWISDGLYKLFTCFACLSTWVGAILSLVDILLTDVCFTPFNTIFSCGQCYWWLVIPLDAFFACATTWLLHQLEEYMENHTVVLVKDDQNKKEILND